MFVSEVVLEVKVKNTIIMYTYMYIVALNLPAITCLGEG